MPKMDLRRERKRERERLFNHMFREVLCTRGASWSELSVNRELGGRIWQTHLLEIGWQMTRSSSGVKGCVRGLLITQEQIFKSVHSARYALTPLILFIKLLNSWKSLPGIFKTLGCAYAFILFLFSQSLSLFFGLNSRALWELMHSEASKRCFSGKRSDKCWA